METQTTQQAVFLDKTVLQKELKLYNTLSRKKELFEPLEPPFVGMYVCGPTVYNDPHIGNARPAVFFDVLYRYLQFLGYKVRYVRNITDVGHLTDDSDRGEDKIAKKAKLEQVEPMQIVNKYTNRYLAVMDKLNVLRPDIAPTATGHILEQIEFTQRILNENLAYVTNGSVYFDVHAYQQKYQYGELSGRILDELLANTRELDGQEEKRNPADFALWKKATPEHIMRWNSPWGEGFPGWHLECTVMSTKYLGTQFDIHGGGMDLMFPHHECEIAQARAANKGKPPVKYWLHNNMVTVNGQKMGKSLGNFITLEELLTGTHPLLQQAYSPMTIRFFILQAHYRSTLDFSNEALLAAQKAYKRLINGLRIVKKMQYPESQTTNLNEKAEGEIKQYLDTLFKAMNDDLNTALAIAQLFNLLKKINQFYLNPTQITAISQETFATMQYVFVTFIEQILGIQEENTAEVTKLIEALLHFYKEAKETKDYAKVDKIRAYFKENKLIIKDLKTGIDWAYDEA
ncbi:MAG: cysteine--tRNA ligase [Microscillaceae bacterium]|nr:cysteine--tRNA ligase [Microscillaceae bacterium]MDW8459713.1 cysteine--tRNA ligase [Cytophagales bacterium]